MSLVAVAPLIALSVYYAQEDRNRENKNLRDEAIQLVNFTLIEEAQTIDGTRQLLLTLSNLPKQYFTDSVRCKNYLSHVLVKFNRYIDIGVVNKNGSLFASGRSTENKKDYSKSEFFEEVMDKSGFSIGEYFVDPISHKRIINLGYPILDEKQRIKAVLFASLDVSYIDLIEKDLAKIFHEKSLFIKIDDEGNIIATNSDSVEQVKSILTPTFLSNVSEQETGIVEAPGPNNQKYLFVFATTQSNLFQQKLYLIVGVNKEKFFAEINKTLYRNLFLIGALFAIILAGVFILSDKYILKTVKKLIKATKEMSTGNLKVRSNVSYGSGELGQLAIAFDRMAESLEDQNNAREEFEKSLRESEERFRNLFEHSPVSLWLEDHSEIKRHIDQLRTARIEDFRMYFQTHPEELANCVTMLKVIAVNKAALELYQAKNKEDLLKGLAIIFRKESYAVFTEELIALTSGKTVFECEAKTQTLTGKINYVIFKLSILPGYEETWLKVLVSMMDITEHKRTEMLLREAHERLQTIIQASPLAILALDPLGRIMNWNAGAEQMFGWSEQETVGKVCPTVPSEWLPDFHDMITQVVQGKTFSGLLRCRQKKDGTQINASITSAPLRNAAGEAIGAIAILKDVTERTKSEEERSKLFTEVQEAENQLRLLSRRLLETQESERKNISRELHDEIGQTLTAAKINLQSIQRITKSQKIENELDVTISYLEQSLQQVRDISLDLRPSILDDLGIEAALRWLITRFTQNTKLKFELEFSPANLKLPKELELDCYRVTQEALNNIVKHAGAKNVNISLLLEGKLIHLKIADNGKRFDVQKARELAIKGKSLGILGMEERVKLAGGEFKIKSSDKIGTEVCAAFPLV
ncbi:MAG: PAS domain S-box protein [Bacteroidota bacterium]